MGITSCHFARSIRLDGMEPAAKRCAVNPQEEEESSADEEEDLLDYEDDDCASGFNSEEDEEDEEEGTGETEEERKERAEVTERLRKQIDERLQAARELRHKLECMCHTHSNQHDVTNGRRSWLSWMPVRLTWPDDDTKPDVLMFAHLPGFGRHIPIGSRVADSEVFATPNDPRTTWDALAKMLLHARKGRQSGGHLDCDDVKETAKTHHIQLARTIEMHCTLDEFNAHLASQPVRVGILTLKCK